MNSLNPLVLLAFALTANQLTPGSFAATSVWDGGGANALWATAGNWSNNTLPASGNDVLIGSAFGSGKTITLSGNRYVNSVTFSNASSVTLVASTGISLGGHVLHVATGDFTAKGSGLTTVDCRVNLASPGIFHIGYGRKLEFKRSVQGAPPPTNPSYFFYAGIHKTGDGELILGGTNTFGGVLFVEDGKLSVTTSNALPYTVLYVRGHPYDPTELHFGTGATPNINYLLLEGETVVTGGSNAKLYAGSIGLRDQADVDVVLAGSADVLVNDGAEAILRRNNTFTGDITFGYGSVLTVEHDPSLGNGGNTLHFKENAELVVDDLDGLTASQRTLLVDTNVQALLEIRGELGCRLAGPGTVVIKIEGGGTIALDGNNEAFTGRLFSNKHLEVTHPDAFGDADRIILEAGKDILFEENIDAPGTDLETSSGSLITLNNRNVTLHHLRVGSGNDTTLQLSADATDRTLHLQDIVFLGASGNLDIEGWLGSAVGSIGDRVEVSGSLSNSDLQRIRLNGFAVKKLNGELVYAQ